MIGDDERCVALAGLLPVRLLAERAGLTAGISAAMRRPDYHPDYDRGQVLVDLGLVELAGGQAISDFQALAHLEKLIGPVPSTPTVWRALDEADAVQVTRIHQATCRFRRLWWAILKSRPEGFPWLSVAGRELTGITVIDLDASVVKVASDQKENATPTYKGGVGFVPNLATCDDVDDLLMIDPRPGNATSNDAADNIAVLTAAIAAIPGSYRRCCRRRRCWWRCPAAVDHQQVVDVVAGGQSWGRTRRRPCRSAWRSPSGDRPLHDTRSRSITVMPVSLPPRAQPGDPSGRDFGIAHRGRRNGQVPVDRVTCTASASSRARQTVGVDGTGPISFSRCARAWKSLIAGLRPAEPGPSRPGPGRSRSPGDSRAGASRPSPA